MKDCVLIAQMEQLMAQLKELEWQLNKHQRALKVAKERIQRHWSGNSEDTCLEIANILQEDRREVSSH